MAQVYPIATKRQLDQLHADSSALGQGKLFGQFQGGG